MTATLIASIQAQTRNLSDLPVHVLEGGDKRVLVIAHGSNGSGGFEWTPIENEADFWAGFEKACKDDADFADEEWLTIGLIALVPSTLTPDEITVTLDDPCYELVHTARWAAGRPLFAVDILHALDEGNTDESDPQGMKAVVDYELPDYLRGCIYHRDEDRSRLIAQDGLKFEITSTDKARGVIIRPCEGREWDELRPVELLGTSPKNQILFRL